MSVSHWMRSTPVNRRKFFATSGAMSAALVAAACSSAPEVVVTQTVTPGQATSSAVTVPPTNASSAAAATSAATSAANPVRIIASPKFGSTDIAPTAVVTVTTFNAKIQELSVTGTNGPVAGALDAGGATWTLTDRLEFGQTYTFAGTAVDAGGVTSPITGELTTVSPSSTTTATFVIEEGGTYGVGQPIVIVFDGQVSNRAEAEKALKVSTDKGDIVGSWGWLQDEDIQANGNLQSQVHWRPAEFWPANTAVTVDAKLYGVDFGGGNWGGDDITRKFKIGRALIVTADVNTFRLKVEVDGVQVKDYPVSYGRGDNGRATRSGIHVVQGKYPEYDMCNAAFGYCGVEVTWAVRINNNGEFIHENDSTIASQGVANVSHGCVNMSTANAKDFYDMAFIGDPVLVSNTGANMSAADYIYDWIYDYATWKGFSAI